MVISEKNLLTIILCLEQKLSKYFGIKLNIKNFYASI